MQPAISKSLIQDIRALIEQSHIRVKHSINSEMVLLYWNIGSSIRSEILRDTRAEYGQQVIAQIAKQLQAEYGRGFNQSALTRMIRFAELFPDSQIVATLSQQLSWSHLIELLPVKDELEREFYIQMIRLEHWSVRTLRERMTTLLYQRTALSKKPEDTIRNDLERIQKSPHLSSELIFRNPYVLDFLGLQDTFSEKDLEHAILREIERFLLEMGAGFTFVSRQQRITVGGDDFYIDLLLYHRDLRCLVAIDLKLEKFQPSFAGQMQFYLRYLDKFERRENENTPIGLILCSSANTEQVELLDLERDDIRVAEYLTKLPPLEALRDRLHLAILKAREQE